MSTAAIYLRISQDDTGEGLALDRQQEACLAFIRERGWTPGETYTDDSISATSGALRPAFERLLEDAPALVVVWHLDRLVRITRDLERVIDSGLSVHAVKAGMLDLSTPAGRAVARTVTAWATYEGEQKALRQIARNEQDRSKGRPYWKTRPFGYTSDAEQVPEEAAAIAWAYQALLDGATLGRITREWNSRGLKSRHRDFTPVVVRGVLHHARNAGILTYKREELGPGNWEPIVPEETYRAAVALLEAPGRYQGGGGRTANLLTGVAVCGICGAPVMKGAIKGPRPAYMCQKERNNRVPLKETEAVVIGRTLALLTSGEAAALIAEDQDLVDLRNKATELRRKLKEWEEAAASIGPAEYVRITKGIRAELEDVLEGMARRDASTALLAPEGADWTDQEIVERAYEVWEAMPLAKRQAILRLLWKSITLLPRNGDRSGNMMPFIRFERH